MPAAGHQPPKNRHSQRRPNPKIFSKLTPYNELTHFELNAMLKRDPDLTESVRIGTILLEQNKELQEKNEFLEESLTDKNEAIAQLTTQLKQNRELFQKISSIEEQDGDEQKIEKQSKPSGHSKRLENKLKQLEGENEELRSKAKQTEELRTIAEKREEQRINDYISQLRTANLKVAQLHIQLGEKSTQLGVQAKEIEKLLKEIVRRKDREKLLWEENEDLHFRLDEALSNHKQLELDMNELQEYHFSLVEMLRETESELKVYRERALAVAPPRRSNSTDSLYDSLASELEGADSGCYGTPIYSARYGPSPHWSSLSTGTTDQPCCSSNAINHPEMQTISDCPNDPNEFTENAHVGDDALKAQSFDVPSRALLHVVKSTFEDRRHFRRLSPSRPGQRQMTIDEMKDENIDTDEQSTPAMCEKPNWTETEEVAGEPAMEKEKAAEKTTQLRDASCSPIQFPPIKSESCCHNIKGIKPDENIQNDEEVKDDVQPFMVSSRLHRHTCTASSSATSDSDSFDDCSPKLGVPGRPGTRDLDNRIKRLGLRKEIDENYKKFRAKRGLLPVSSGFYSSNTLRAIVPFVSSDDQICQSTRVKLLTHASTQTKPGFSHLTGSTEVRSAGIVSSSAFLVSDAATLDFHRSSSNHELSSNAISNIRPQKCKFRDPTDIKNLSLKNISSSRSIDRGISNLISDPSITHSSQSAASSLIVDLPPSGILQRFYHFN